MQFNYKGLNVHYDCIGQGKRMVIIHGWGGSEVWRSYMQAFAQKGFQVFLITLPGFGDSETPDDAVDSYFYADLIKKWMEDLEIDDPIIMGHSLGGKIATILNTKHEIGSKLILIDTAGFRRFYLITWIKIVAAKIGKYLLNIFGVSTEELLKNKDFAQKIGSVDYAEAGSMRETLKVVTNEDIRDLFKEVKVPTMIVWGENDLDTPLVDAVEIHRNIKNSQLRVFENSGHFPFVEHPSVFIDLITEYSLDDEN